MRFGKRTKNPLSWGWRGASTIEQIPEDFAEAPDGVSSPLPPNEAVVLGPAMPAALARPETGERVVTSDPTQRLLTSLGRFQRHVMKAREGASQDLWSDECMNHLIHGVEIALEQDWADLVEALTETGRILQSYEDAGRANACVPFLADSYEILCLMVGDLIVDKVRPGVLRKWRDCYQAALDDLTAEGLALVQDEEGGSRFHGHNGSHVEPETSGAPEPSPRDAFEAFEVPGLGGLHELPPLAPVMASDSHDAPEMPFSIENSGSVGESPFAVPDFNREPSGYDDVSDLAPPEFDVLFEPGAEPDFASTPGGETEEGAGSTGSSRAVLGLDRDIAELLDMLCDGLARIESDPFGARGTVFLAIEDGLNTLHERAGQHGWDGSLRACETMARLCEAATQREGGLGDRFYETAYAFGGVFGEAKERADDENLRNWLAECGALIDEWQSQPILSEPLSDGEPQMSDEMPFELPSTVEAPAAEFDIDVPSLNGSPAGVAQAELPPELPSEESADAGDSGASVDGQMEKSPSPSEEGEIEGGSQYLEISSVEPSTPERAPEDDPAAVFLETARQAIGAGSTADAKLFAMQAAASIAKAQAKEAEARVRQAEIRLQETVKSIDIARDQVKSAEAQVEDSEIRVEQGKESLAERDRHTHGVLGSLEGIRTRISDLDRRIQELQAQRDEALRQQSAAEEALAEAREQEDDAKSQLDDLKNSEQMARVQLEDARGQVKLLQRKQGEIEALMERARDSLTRYRDSVADIDRTIELIRNAETGAVLDGDDLLF
jgi:hypothetical protein